MPAPSPRNEERHIVPSISMTIQIDFHVDPVLFVGLHWDVSCASSLWVDRLESASYVGVRFLETVDFNTTFLIVLMRRSGGHSPVGGFGDLRSGTAFGSFS